MLEQFDLRPTDEEIVFARMRHLHNLEFFREQPFVLTSFSEFWHLTNAGERRQRYAEELHDRLRQYKQISVLMNGGSKSEYLWRKAVLANRRWVEALSDEDKAELKAFDTYANWHPGLLVNDPITINGVLKLFPNISDAGGVPDIVRKYENPDSPDALPGAVDINTHDAIHSLLGRGALQADEAFVIGFTMGGASNELTQDHIDTYICAITEEYPHPYTIKPDYVPSYLLGVAAGQAYYLETAIDLSKTDFSELRDIPLGKLRQQFGIDIDKLSFIYGELEANMIPGGKSPDRNRGPIPVERILAVV